jgi:hypothetical protein
MIFSEEIIKKTAYDSELKKIVYYIASMSDEQKEDFKKKLNLYFFDKNSENDVEAYRFYKVLLENNNAQVLQKEIKKILNE